MTVMFKTMLVIVLSGFFSLFIGVASPGKSFAEVDNSSRTSHRTVFGRKIYPKQGVLPRNYSNWEQQRQHPAAWDGQDWDSSRWNPADWSVDIAVAKFFRMRIFERQYIRAGGIPVVELGPTFYKLSDLDRRRTLKLLAEQDHVFDQGYGIVELIDWLTGDIIGVYTPKGMYLN